MCLFDVGDGGDVGGGDGGYVVVVGFWICYCFGCFVGVLGVVIFGGVCSFYCFCVGGDDGLVVVVLYVFVGGCCFGDSFGGYVVGGGVVCDFVGGGGVVVFGVGYWFYGCIDYFVVVIVVGMDGCLGVVV